MMTTKVGALRGVCQEWQSKTSVRTSGSSRAHHSRFVQLRLLEGKPDTLDDRLGFVFRGIGKFHLDLETESSGETLTRRSVRVPA